MDTEASDVSSEVSDVDVRDTKVQAFSFFRPGRGSSVNLRTLRRQREIPEAKPEKESVPKETETDTKVTKETETKTKDTTNVGVFEKVAPRRESVFQEIEKQAQVNAKKNIKANAVADAEAEAEARAHSRANAELHAAQRFSMSMDIPTNTMMHTQVRNAPDRRHVFADESTYMRFENLTEAQCKSLLGSAGRQNAPIRFTAYTDGMDHCQKICHTYTKLDLESRRPYKHGCKVQGAWILEEACGIGSVLKDGICIPDKETIQPKCGPGMILKDQACIPVCGQGTVEKDHQCVSEISCGAGTIMRDSKCVAAL